MTASRKFFDELRSAYLIAGVLFGGIIAFSLAFYFEVAKLHRNISENSAVEILQLALLTAVGFMFLTRGARRPDWRGGMILVGGFFLCAGIRELDSFFDKLLFHGAWIPFACAVAAVCTVFAWREKTSTFDGLSAVAADRNFALLCVGMAVLLVFSRLFGGKHVWSALAELAGDADGVVDVRFFKNFGEEVTEALGDVIIFLWAVLFRGPDSVKGGNRNALD